MSDIKLILYTAVILHRLMLIHKNYVLTSTQRNLSLLF